MADFLYGDGLRLGAGPPVRPGSGTWCCVCLAFSLLFHSGSSSEKGGSPPSPPPPPPPPPLLTPTLGWPPRDGLVSAPQLPTPGWPLEERRETPPRLFLGGGVEGERLGVRVFPGGEVFGPGFG